jgi:hypothetical protein
MRSRLSSRLAARHRPQAQQTEAMVVDQVESMTGLVADQLVHQHSITVISSGVIGGACGFYSVRAGVRCGGPNR